LVRGHPATGPLLPIGKAASDLNPGQAKPTKMLQRFGIVSDEQLQTQLKWSGLPQPVQSF